MKKKRQPEILSFADREKTSREQPKEPETTADGLRSSVREHLSAETCAPSQISFQGEGKCIFGKKQRLKIHFSETLPERAAGNLTSAGMNAVPEGRGGCHRY